MSFLHFDPTRAAHLLARIAPDPNTRADALFERLHQRSLLWTRDAEGHTDPRRATERREQGLAVRLQSSDRSWIESRDRCDTASFADALRRTARSLPTLPLPELELRVDPWAPGGVELDSSPQIIEASLRARRVSFPYRVELTHHRRELVIVGPDVTPEPQHESYLSYRAEIEPSNTGSSGANVLGGLVAQDDGWQERLADQLARQLSTRFRSRDGAAPRAGWTPLVLGPEAVAVLLHEAVAHALEVDLLARSGPVAAAIGHALAPESIDLLDDPGAAPAAVRRSHDDEGAPTIRRWLLRNGRIAQPLCDQRGALRHDAEPGAGRRASRHDLPDPRSTCLHLLPGDSRLVDALSDAPGIYVDQVDAGALQPLTGAVRLQVGCGRAFRGGELTDRLAPFVVEGHLANLLESISTVGADAIECGAGWCAKNGQRLPVWANVPFLRLERAWVEPL